MLLGVEHVLGNKKEKLNLPLDVVSLLETIYNTLKQCTTIRCIDQLYLQLGEEDFLARN